MKIKAELVVLVLVIAVLGAYLVVRNSDRTHYSLPELKAVSVSEPTRVEIREGAGDPIRLERGEDDVWRIQPQGYEADGSKIDAILRTIVELKVTAMISESDAYSRYDLDDARQILVTAWAGDERLREFAVGKAAPSFKHTFVRLDGDPRVYHAAGSFRTSFEQTVGGLRDKQVLAFAPKDVQTITVQKGDTLIVLSREEPAGEASGSEDEAGAQQQPVWKSGQGDSPDAAAVNRLLTTLSDLECSGFLDDAKPSDFGSPLISIRLDGAGLQELTVYPRGEEEEGPYPAVSSSVEEPFQLSSFTAENLMEVFQEKTEAEGEKDPS